MNGEKFARKVMESCPVKHITEGLDAQRFGIPGVNGGGCACGGCIAKAFSAAVEKAVAEERERCAKIVEDTDIEETRGYERSDDGRATLKKASAAIRSLPAGER